MEGTSLRIFSVPVIHALYLLPKVVLRHEFMWCRMDATRASWSASGLTPGFSYLFFAPPGVLGVSFMSDTYHPVRECECRHLLNSKVLFQCKALHLLFCVSFKRKKHAVEIPALTECKNVFILQFSGNRSIPTFKSGLGWRNQWN
jgi:hypothetical protein